MKASKFAISIGAGSRPIAPPQGSPPIEIVEPFDPPAKIEAGLMLFSVSEGMQLKLNYGGRSAIRRRSTK